MKNIFVFCFVVTLCVQISHQCFCPFMGKTVRVSGERVPEVFCYPSGNTKYVVAKIESKTKTGNRITGDMRFDVKIFKIITKSGVKTFKGGKDDSLFAPRADSICGYIDFPIGKRVYVGVSRVDGQYRFNGCSFGRSANEVTDVQKKVMKGDLSCPKKP